MTNSSEKTDEISAALAVAQGQFPVLEKNRTVEVRGTSKNGKDFSYSFDYADLGNIIETTKEALSQNGLSVIHQTLVIETRFWLVTKLLHSSGQWYASYYPLPMGGDPKELGGMITYGKRYLMSAMINVAADDDNDAEPQNVKGVSAKNPQGKTLLQKSVNGELPVYRVPFGSEEIKGKTLEEVYKAFGHERLKKYLGVIKEKSQLDLSSVEKAFIVQCDVFLTQKQFQKPLPPPLPPTSPGSDHVDERMMIVKPSNNNGSGGIDSSVRDKAQKPAENLSDKQTESETSAPVPRATTAQVTKLAQAASDKGVMKGYQTFMKSIGGNSISMTESEYKQALAWINDQPIPNMFKGKR